MIHCAYNSMWIGQIIKPDWDMFQSDHLCAKFHAGSRAICGGPVYVSDSVGGHDFELLKKLVYPDGTIPRCQDFALPTRDCLFRNPLFDKKTILKIWNFNKVFIYFVYKDLDKTMFYYFGYIVAVYIFFIFLVVCK
jgi:stachyose synthetase